MNIRQGDSHIEKDRSEMKQWGRVAVLLDRCAELMWAADNDGPLRVSVCERSKWKDGIRNKKQRPGMWKSSPPVWMFARASFKGFPSSVYLGVTIFREDQKLCEKKTTSELREEKRPYLFFGKELAVFKSRPRHYFKRPSLGFPVPKNTKRPGCFFFFFFFFTLYRKW